MEDPRHVIASNNMELFESSIPTPSQEIKDNLFLLAAKNGHLKQVQILLEDGANIHYEYDSALRYASGAGHIDVVTLLIMSGANVNARHVEPILSNTDNHPSSRVGLHALLNKIETTHQNNRKYLTDRNGSPLELASENGHLKIVQLLLENGADVTDNNNSALLNASTKGHFEIVQLLLEYGADATANNNKAIVQAAINKHHEILQLLLNSISNKKDPIIRIPHPGSKGCVYRKGLIGDTGTKDSGVKGDTNNIGDKGTKEPDNKETDNKEPVIQYTDNKKPVIQYTDNKEPDIQHADNKDLVIYNLDKQKNELKQEIKQLIELKELIIERNELKEEIKLLLNN